MKKKRDESLLSVNIYKHKPLFVLHFFMRCRFTFCPFDFASTSRGVCVISFIYTFIFYFKMSTLETSMKNGRY